MLSGASNQKAVAPSDRVSGTNCLRKNCRRWLNRRWTQNAGVTQRVRQHLRREGIAIDAASPTVLLQHFGSISGTNYRFLSL